jgi:RNA polymerase sigma factor (sigma-70 family)
MGTRSKLPEEAMMTEEELSVLVAGAASGDRSAAEKVLASIQDTVYGLALRMLGHPADAEDATQEVLIVVLTHLGSFRGESAFRTWAFRIATTRILRFRRGRRETDSFEALEARLDQAFRDDPPGTADAETQLLAREVRLRCTEAMLLSLDRDERMAILLGDVLELPGELAAKVLEIEPAAYRQRLSRARTRLLAFMRRRCGVFDPENRCRCEGVVAGAVASKLLDPDHLLFANHPTRAGRALQPERGADEIEALGRVAEVIRSHPDYAAPDAVQEGLRDLLRSGSLRLLDS